MSLTWVVVTWTLGDKCRGWKGGGRGSIRRGEDRGNATRAAGLPTVALHCMHIGQKVHNRIQKSHCPEPFTSSHSSLGLADAADSVLLYHTDRTGSALLGLRFDHEPSRLGFMVNGVALGRDFPQYFSLHLSSFHQCFVHFSILILLFSEGRAAEV